MTKVGAPRDAKAAGPGAGSEQLRQAVHDNLRNLGLDALDVVNLRVGGLDRPTPGSIAEPFTALAELQQEGLIRHLGLSTLDAGQIAEAQSIAPVVCVQNFYNLANRGDDDLIGSLAAQGIAYVPFFPLGGFNPLQSDELDSVAERSDTPMAVALAWLLQRSPNILLIPGTSSVAHLRENVAGAGLALPGDDLAELDRSPHDLAAATGVGLPGSMTVIPALDAGPSRRPGRRRPGPGRSPRRRAAPGAACRPRPGPAWARSPGPPCRGTRRSPVPAR